jgi:hypothetical protein
MIVGRRLQTRLVVSAGLAAGLAVLVTIAPGAQESPPAARRAVTIKEIMEMTIAPASDTLWSAQEAPTDREWLALEQAAVTLLVAANAVAAGGGGPRDADWAKQPAWQAFDRVLGEAAYAALEAVRMRDVAALQSAGDVLYPPCEGCHLQFNPAVVGEP